MQQPIIRPQMFRNLFALVVLACSASCMADVDEQTGQEMSELNLGTSFYDGGTQCSAGGVTMHCCPDGSVMIGANIDRNVFKCGQTIGTGGLRFLDIATQRNNMHACPWGTVMVGLHVGHNWLVCQAPPSAPVFEYVDSSTQDPFPMHKCSDGSAMAGIHVDDNLFTCDF